MKTVHTMGALAALAAVLVSGPTYASAETEVRERSRTISYADLDLNTEAGARTVLKRIGRAARQVCFSGVSGVTHDLHALKCRRNAVRDAVARLDRPMVTIAYSGAERPVRLARR